MGASSDPTVGGKAAKPTHRVVWEGRSRKTPPYPDSAQARRRPITMSIFMRSAAHSLIDLRVVPPVRPGGPYAMLEDSHGW
jgi:hypothetical protein